MLQRNTSGYPINLPTLSLGRLIHPGEDFDHEERLAGFTPVDELESPDAAEGEPDSENTPATGRDESPTSGDSPASDAQPDTTPRVGHAADLPLGSTHIPVGDLPARTTTPDHTATVEPLHAEEA